MAEFCNDCLKTVMEISPKSKTGKLWLCKNGTICEQCGFKYLEKQEVKP